MKMKVALLDDSVLDNSAYVRSESECVEATLRDSGIPSTLYAVDGSIIQT